MTRAWNKLIFQDHTSLSTLLFINLPLLLQMLLSVSSSSSLPGKTYSRMLVLAFSYISLSRSSIFNKRPCAGSKKGTWALMELTKFK